MVTEPGVIPGFAQAAAKNSGPEGGVFSYLNGFYYEMQDRKLYKKNALK